MRKKWFTSDWHLGDDRGIHPDKPNVFYRPFVSLEALHLTIWRGFCGQGFKNGDVLYHLGDVFVDFNKGNHIDVWKLMKQFYPDSVFHLIQGNYDEQPEKQETLQNIFSTIKESDNITINGRDYYLNHYPLNCLDKGFSLTGHIHGAWKTQRTMINVGVDAWHFRPVSEDTIHFCRNAIEKYYDDNVFPFDRKK